MSHKGCPFDNAVAESTYKSLKVEFVYQYTFETLQQLDLELFDYVNWWNHLRLHGTLGYETPVGYRNQRLAQRILDNELGCANAARQSNQLLAPAEDRHIRGGSCLGQSE